MSIDATADALVGNEVLPAETTYDEDAALSAAFDKAQEITDEPVIQEEPAPEQSELKPEPEPAPEAPSDLPKAIRDNWAAVPEEARAALVESHRELSKKLTDQGRLVQGLAPIQNVLTGAIKDMPWVANMRPDEVASELMELAKAGHALQTKPAETILNIAKRYGVEDQIRAAFSGQPQEPQTQSLLKEIAALKGELKRVSDPDYLRSQVSAVTHESRVMDEVTNFAKTADHWDKVENHVPLLIPAVKAKLGEGASTADVLKLAYETAIGIYAPEIKAKAEAAAQAAQSADPEKTEAALKAKSVNITGKSTGRTRALSEDEMLAAAYDRARQR